MEQQKDMMGKDAESDEVSCTSEFESDCTSNAESDHTSDPGSIEDVQLGFIHACKSGNVGKVKRLIEDHGTMMMMISDREGMTAFDHACVSGSVDTVNLLIEHGVDVMDRDDEGMTAFHYACDSGSVDTVKLLVENGAEVMDRDDEGMTAFDHACVSGSVDTVKLLIEDGFDVMTREHEGMIAFDHACVSGSVDTVKLLIEHGVDVMARDWQGMTAFHHACQSGSVDTVKLLIEHGVDVMDRDYHVMTAFHHACQSGSVDTMKLLIEHGAEVMSRDVMGMTAFHHVCRSSSVDAVKLLLEHGFDVMGRDVRGRTSLPHACWSGSVDVVKLLIEHGVDVMARDYGGRTALHRACRSDSVDTVKLLIEHGGEVMARDEHGDTPLHIGIIHLDVVKLLWDSGANLNAKNKRNQTPLGEAIRYNCTEVFKYLVSKGADISLVEQDDDLTETIRKKGFSQHVLEQTVDFVDPQTINAINFKEGRTKYHTIKSVILGRYESGKTSLLRTLKENMSSCTKKSERTIGVEVDAVQLDETLSANMYDFGGHETYTFLHQVCLTVQTLICIVVDMSTYSMANFKEMVGDWYHKCTARVLQPYMLLIGTKIDICEDKDNMYRIGQQTLNELKKIEKKECSTLQDALNDLTDLHKRLTALLPALGTQNIAEFVQKLPHENPMLSKKIDEIFQHVPGINAMNIEREIEFLEVRLSRRPKVHENFIFVSSKDFEGIHKLRQTMCHIVRDNPSLFPPFDIPVSWTHVLKHIKSEKLAHIIDLVDFENICGKYNISMKEGGQLILDLLRSTGQLLHYRSNRPLCDLDNIVILRPNWVFEIIGSIYNHFYLSGEKPIPTLEDVLEEMHLTQHEVKNMYREFMRCGIMRQEVLDYVFGVVKVKRVDQPRVLGVLTQFDICCVHTTAATEGPGSKETRMYRFPCLLSENPPDEVATEWPDETPDGFDEYNVCVFFNTSVEPSGLYEKWSIRTNDLFRKRFDWKYGSVATDINGKSKIKMVKHVDVGDGDIWFELSVRGQRDKAAEARNIFLVAYAQLNYLHRQYPYVRLKWWALCPICREAGQWPLDKVIKIDNREITCDNCDFKMKQHRLFPAYSMELASSKILTLVGKSLCHDWKSFLRSSAIMQQLELDSKINEIEHRYREELIECGHEAVITWYKCRGASATSDSLIEDLEKVNLQHLSDKVKQMLGIY